MLSHHGGLIRFGFVTSEYKASFLLFIAYFAKALRRKRIDIERRGRLD
jgi:hypothetical protein